ncbi:hypothetical protein J2S19_001487 [Metabacillus malikii]|uniref:ATP-dependent DNA helicase PcrA n=1 Tax=Metabacillus malikii TaxID=1504265 RepID=A0ABT9ZD90_9BACI|nr:hypothetical protein [Metabacillus malikii]
MGEKLEIISKVYLSPFGVTRAEQELYLTNAKMRTLFGRTNINPESRFIAEIPDELIEDVNNSMKKKAAPAASSMNSGRKVEKRPPVSRPIARATGGDDLPWAVGDKAEHKKWGTGTVVSVKGSGEGMELDIAFPSPVGIKRLLAKFAPINRV